MKTFNTFIYMGLLAGLSTSFAQKLSKEATNRYVGLSTYTFTAEAPGQLVIENIRGDLVMTGEPKDHIEIVESITIRSKSEEGAKTLFENVRASIQQTSSENEPLVIRVTGQRSRKRDVSFDYTVIVPVVFSTLVQTRGGDLRVENIKGEIDISTAGGNVDVSDLNGRISASTSGGNVDAADLSGRVTLHTSGGDIDVEDVQGELGARTSGGDIDVQDIQGTVSVNTSGGDLDLSYIEGREVIAQTSGGDITVNNLKSSTYLSTTGGDIQIQNITGDLEATTSGGEIDMEEITGNVTVWTSAGSINGEDIGGSLDARTSAGNIYITKIVNPQLENHDIDLKTSAGDLELILPRDFPATFSARSLTPGGRSEDTIVTDFPLEIIATRAMVRAKGITGDGKFNVNLETSVGCITISRED